MSKITEQQLISQLKELKNIKPKQEWASLLKSQILAEKSFDSAQDISPANPARFIFQYKEVYAFATMLLLVVGFLGFNQFSAYKSKLAANMYGQAVVIQDIERLNNRISTLSDVTKTGKKESINTTIKEINANATELVRNLKGGQINDESTIKKIATSLKTLSSVSGTDLTKDGGVRDLYETIVARQIADLEKATLTDRQKVIFEKIEELYKEGKFSEALEEILSVSE